MSDEPTQTLPDGPSFEERVLTRLDAIDARLQALEGQAERRAMETKPIWERALAEILEVKQSLANVERKIDVLSRDIVQVRADQAHVESRLDKLESKPVQ
jgi:tetrahydromethanopterin S-methyltransferase subunit G